MTCRLKKSQSFRKCTNPNFRKCTNVDMKPFETLWYQIKSLLNQFLANFSTKPRTYRKISRMILMFWKLENVQNQQHGSRVWNDSKKLGHDSRYPTMSHKKLCASRGLVRLQGKSLEIWNSINLASVSKPKSSKSAQPRSRLCQCRNKLRQPRKLALSWIIPSTSDLVLCENSLKVGSKVKLCFCAGMSEICFKRIAEVSVKKV